MGSPEVKNFASAAVIFAVLIGGAIAVMILAGTDFSNFLPFLAKEEVIPPVVESTAPVVESAAEEVIVGTEEKIEGMLEPITEEVEEKVVEKVENTYTGTPQLWKKAP